MIDLILITSHFLSISTIINASSLSSIKYLLNCTNRVLLAISNGFLNTRSVLLLQLVDHIFNRSHLILPAHNLIIKQKHMYVFELYQIQHQIIFQLNTHIFYFILVNFRLSLLLIIYFLLVLYFIRPINLKLYHLLDLHQHSMFILLVSEYFIQLYLISPHYI